MDNAEREHFALDWQLVALLLRRVAEEEETVDQLVALLRGLNAASGPL